MHDDTSEPKWGKRSRELMAIAQNGLTYAEDYFDRERPKDMLLEACSAA